MSVLSPLFTPAARALDLIAPRYGLQVNISGAAEHSPGHILRVPNAHIAPIEAAIHFWTDVQHGASYKHHALVRALNQYGLNGPQNSIRDARLKNDLNGLPGHDDYRIETLMAIAEAYNDKGVQDYLVNEVGPGGRTTRSNFMTVIKRIPLPRTVHRSDNLVIIAAAPVF